MEFTLLQEARILYGAGKVQETGALLRRLGVDKALVVCDEGVKKAGIVERVTNSLTQARVEFALFDKVQADPPSEVVDEGAAFCRAERWAGEAASIRQRGSICCAAIRGRSWITPGRKTK